MKCSGHFLEQEGGLGIYHAGARMYDPEVPRFYGVDAMRGKYPWLSSYVYAANNPLIFIDPDGNEISVSELYRKDDEGNYVHAAQVEAFEEFINTDAGRAELARYASAGQTIAGITFDSDGDLHVQGINLAYTGNMEGVNNAPASVVGGELNIEITLGENADLITVIHETIIHGRQYSADFIDNRQLDFSHIAPDMLSWLQDKLPQNWHHHQEVYRDRALLKDGTTIYRQARGNAINNSDLRDKLYRFVPRSQRP